MRKYASEHPRPLTNGEGDGKVKNKRDWWEIVRDQGPIPDTAFRVVTLPNQLPNKAKGDF